MIVLLFWMANIKWGMSSESKMEVNFLLLMRYIKLRHFQLSNVQNLVRALTKHIGFNKISNLMNKICLAFPSGMRLCLLWTNLDFPCASVIYSEQTEVLLVIEN